MMKMKNAILMMALAVGAVGCANQAELSKGEAHELVSNLWKSDTLSTELNTANRDLVDTDPIKTLESKGLLTVTRKWTIADGGEATMLLTDAAKKYELSGDKRYPLNKRLLVALRNVEVKDIQYENKSDVLLELIMV